MKIIFYSFLIFNLLVTSSHSQGFTSFAKSQEEWNKISKKGDIHIPDIGSGGGQKVTIILGPNWGNPDDKRGKKLLAKKFGTTVDDPWVDKQVAKFKANGTWESIRYRLHIGGLNTKLGGNVYGGSKSFNFKTLDYAGDYGQKNSGIKTAVEKTNGILPPGESCRIRVQSFALGELMGYKKALLKHMYEAPKGTGSPRDRVIMTTMYIKSVKYLFANDWCASAEYLGLHDKEIPGFKDKYKGTMWGQDCLHACIKFKLDEGGYAENDANMFSMKSVCEQAYITGGMLTGGAHFVWDQLAQCRSYRLIKQEGGSVNLITKELDKSAKELEQGLQQGQEEEQNPQQSKKRPPRGNYGAPKGCDHLPPPLQKKCRVGRAKVFGQEEEQNPQQSKKRPPRGYSCDQLPPRIQKVCNENMASCDQMSTPRIQKLCHENMVRKFGQ